MTNKEYLDHLAHNAPDQLAAWFAADHDFDRANLEAERDYWRAEYEKLRAMFGDDGR